MTSAIQGISISSICFLKSASGSFTIKQMRVSNSFELKGFGTLTYNGLGVGFSGTWVNVNVKWIAASSSASNYFFFAVFCSSCLDLKNFWSAFTAEITCLVSMFFSTSDSILLIFFDISLAFSFLSLTKSDSKRSLSVAISSLLRGASEDYFLLVFFPIFILLRIKYFININQHQKLDKIYFLKDA